MTERFMFSWNVDSLWWRFTAIAGTTLILSTTSIQGQGTITFDAHPIFSGTNYVEAGMRFQLVIPPYGPYYDVMATMGGGGNAFMVWFRQYNPYNYVQLRLTNGSTFGLTSVWLADPSETSPSQVSISFIGFLVNGSTVTNTFVTLGVNKYAFQNYTFTSEFASDLLSVRIDAPRWAMDNLRWVPEPSTYALLGLGLLTLAWRRFHQRRKL